MEKSIKECSPKAIIAVDLYGQSANYNDILELGMFETSENYIKIIEWPELIKFKPKDRIDIKFKYTKNTNSREVEFFGLGKCKYYKLNEI